MTSRIDIIGQNGNDGLHYDHPGQDYIDKIHAVINDREDTVEKDIDDILEERGSRYGDFKDHAEIAQSLKDIILPFKGKLSKSQMESLEMIFHKIGRILNGDPDYKDSWTDIAGYAKLVADQLED
jgi:predicted transcriptional regulator